MEKESLTKGGRGINIVLVSKEQDNDRLQLDKILAATSGILGCGNCHSGKMLVPLHHEEIELELKRLGNAQIDNIFVANRAGDVKSLSQLAKGGM
jgi:hypothetical protein